MRAFFLLWREFTQDDGPQHSPRRVTAGIRKVLVALHYWFHARIKVLWPDAREVPFRIRRDELGVTFRALEQFVYGGKLFGRKILAQYGLKNCRC